MKALVYVTRDIERALGRNPEGSYFIITNRTPYAEEVQRNFPDSIWLIDSPEGRLLDTHELLEIPEVRKAILDHDASVIVFKNTRRIEELAREHNIKLLNPSADLAEKIENKITQVGWLGDTARFLPQHSIIKAGNIQLEKNSDGSAKPLIVQWAHSHTGDGTMLIGSQNELDVIKGKFPLREARVSEFVSGPVFTVNIAVVPEQTDPLVIGNISYQITGLPPFTDNPYSTIGNDWSLPHSILTELELASFNTIIREVGMKMNDAGWRGLFGIDAILNIAAGTLHLLEINARQPASTTFESQLQTIMSQHSVKGITMFEAHIAGLTATDTGTSEAIFINDGAQIIQRITAAIKNDDKNSARITAAVPKLREQNYIVVEYANTETNSDFLRIQSSEGLFIGHNEPNIRGKAIIEILEQ